MIIFNEMSFLLENCGYHFGYIPDCEIKIGFIVDIGLSCFFSINNRNFLA